MHTRQITDDLDQLLELLPLAVQKALASSNNRTELIEVVLDLGRLPEARYPDRVIKLGQEYLSKDDLDATVSRLGAFGPDNRAGIEKTLHRISAILNRQKEVIGLTCRVGRAVFGTVSMIRDLIESEKSLLLLGRPGVGKTTALREIARVMADELQRRVIIIDTSNEIAGDGDIPHPAIGRARRMQVARPEQQHQVMIEAVENHMPEVIVIDEIGTEPEAQAARTIAERGVQLIATAHGNELENLIKNPTLSDLVGGIQAVTLGDEEARRRRTQKTVLERASEPTFPIAVEINNRSRWSIHSDVANTVDLLLRGHPPCPQEREIASDGAIKILNSKESKLKPGSSISNPTTPHNSYLKDSSLRKEIAPSNKTLGKQNLKKQLRVLYFGISQELANEVIRKHNWPIKSTENIHSCDAILSIKNQLGQNQSIRKEARKLKIPIYVIKSNTIHQIDRALERLLKHKEIVPNEQDSSQAEPLNKEDAVDALEECRLAVEKVVVPLGRCVELSPRSEKVIQVQADLVKRYQLKSAVFGSADRQRLRVYPP